MAIAFDAGSQPTPATSDPLTWTHTPVGTPRGVFVAVHTSLSAADSVVAVTYGGVAMTEVTESPQSTNEGGSNDDGMTHLFFLGAGIPTGAQTVSVDMSNTSFTRYARCVTVTAAGDTSLEDSEGAAGTGGDDIVLTLTTAVETFIFAVLFSAAQEDNTVDTGFTEDADQDVATNELITAYKAGVAAGSPTATGNVKPAAAGHIIAAAIKEILAGQPLRKRLGGILHAAAGQRGIW